MDDFSKPTLLVAEDDSDMSFLICHEFQRLAPNWDICHVADGSSALDRLRQEPHPCALITDLDMPRLDGFKLIEAARMEKGLEELYILVFSASDNPKDRDRCERLRADLFLGKFVSIPELRERFSSLIRHQYELAR